MTCCVSCLTGEFERSIFLPFPELDGSPPPPPPPTPPRPGRFLAVHGQDRGSGRTRAGPCRLSPGAACDLQRRCRVAAADRLPWRLKSAPACPRTWMIAVKDKIWFLREGLFAKYVMALVGLVVFVLAVNGLTETWISYRATKTTLIEGMTEKAEATAKRID